MRIGLGLFIGVVLSAWISIAFILEYLNSRRFARIKKNIELKRRQCDVCTAIYFVAVFSEFWRCPRCDSINKEK
ncbi:MAG: hypothetical protein KKH93_02900 [Candidatus Omnitrophica bacterium]|nr:hypothetical protein [Candidatus Omnitrophota bacterium]MBU2043840.1 hypothetical protein [Candidatus Omnitrophota bacterium]MBU2251362.1 hypothetical protein [Candidatus Omnitrophota bacterium]MBU2266269.1 hypothetical protein [Candidatus Omnitrophota bacterium]MBU2473807.1 hypothetical protein [Candidatus Omnitrophota bacterium]